MSYKDEAQERAGGTPAETGARSEEKKGKEEEDLPQSRLAPGPSPVTITVSRSGSG